MLNKLAPRERQIVDLLYQRGELAVSEICESLPVSLSGSAVRAMLKRLEDKGYVSRSDSERGFLYSPTLPDAVVRKTALSDVVRVFFQRIGGRGGERAARHVRPARQCRARRARGDDRQGARGQGSMTMEWMLSLALKSLIVAGLALLLLKAMRNRSAIDRSWIAHLGLAAVLLLPLAAVALAGAGSGRAVVPGAR